MPIEKKLLHKKSAARDIFAKNFKQVVPGLRALYCAELNLLTKALSIEKAKVAKHDASSQDLAGSKICEIRAIKISKVQDRKIRLMDDFLKQLVQVGLTTHLSKLNNLNQDIEISSINNTGNDNCLNKDKLKTSLSQVSGILEILTQLKIHSNPDCRNLANEAETLNILLNQNSEKIEFSSCVFEENNKKLHILLNNAQKALGLSAL